MPSTFRILGITLSSIVAAMAQVQTPTLSPAGGEALTVFPLVIDCPTPNAAIHYTLNGSEPTRNDPSISSGLRIMVNRNWTIKAKAWLGPDQSTTATGYFILTGDIAAGASHSLALATRGTVSAWGLQTGGRLGNNSSTAANILSPAISRYATAAIGDARNISAGFDHTVFLKNGGTVFAYGLNGTGQLGDNTTSAATTATQVRKSTADTDVLTGCVATAAGNGFSLALAQNGEVWSWGTKAAGQLGDGMTGGTRLFAGKVFMGTSGSIPLSGINRIAAGGGTALAVNPTTGNVWAWGNNASGQLAQGNTNNLSRALAVKLNATTTLTDALDVSCAQDHAVVLRWKTSDPNLQGRVFCFGQQQHGRLGNNLVASSTIPYPVQVVKSGGVPLDRIVSVAAGSAHTLALDLNGNVWAWGYNLYGAIGDNTTSDKGFAVKVRNPAGTGDLSNIVRIAAGGSGLFGHSIAVGADGTVFTWGYNANGQLGNGVTATSATRLPVAVAAGNLNVAARPPEVTLGYSVAQSESPGQVVLIANPSDPDNNISRVEFFSQGKRVGVVSAPPWQFTVDGLQAGPHQFAARAIDEAGLYGTSIPAHVTITTADGSPDSDGDGLLNTLKTANRLDSLDASGPNDPDGDLDGDGFSNLWETLQNSDPDNAAIQPTGMIVAGVHHSVAVTKDGRLWAWGYNGDGQIGDGTTTTRNSPVPVTRASGMGRIISIAASERYTLALDESGQLWGWGSNQYRQLSSDNTYSFTSPVRIPVPARVIRFSSGPLHAIATDEQGRLWTWGYNGYGQLGNGSTTAVSGFVEVTKPSGMAMILDVTASLYASHARDSNGVVWSWGYNGYGQIGDGTYTDRLIPTAASSSTSMPAIRSIRAGQYHLLALAENGQMWSWGANSYGQLGIGTTNYMNLPAQITTGLTSAVDLASGADHALAISTSGAVWAWGNNSSGQLGNNSTITNTAPSQTSLVTDWNSILKISASSNQSLALKSDGTVWSWGSNDYGWLGHGDTLQRLIPTKLAALKLSNDDSDADGLADSWERFYFGNLSQTGTTIHLMNGVSNSVAHARGLSPLTLDNDNDGLTDAVEIANGLDPLDWADATADLDGDGVPNLWEANMGTSMTNPGVRPAATATVSSFGSIQTAINNLAGNSSNPPWIILQVNPAVFKENITLPWDKRILLIPSNRNAIPEIQGATASPTVSVYGESVIDGFRITHAKGVDGQGVYSAISSGRALSRITNCMIHDNSGSGGGGGAFAAYGRVSLSHCSFFRNSASNYGNALQVGYSASVRLLNSVLWNPNGSAPNEVYVDGILICRNSSVRGGGAAGALDLSPPLLNALGLLQRNSPLRMEGDPAVMTLNDIQGEARGNLPDIGADQFWDVDADGLPDWLEALGVTSPTADNDGDGVSNLAEYLTGTNPSLADTDGDGLNDGAEITAGSNPFDKDSDSDGMTDGWEVQYGLNPTDSLDALADLDGDRIPNLFEFANSTIPNNATSFPAPHITVDPAFSTVTMSQKKTIQSAVSEPFNWNRHTIIRVKPGTYAESITINQYKVLLLGDLGAANPVIEPVNSNAVTVYENSAVLDGFLIRRGTAAASHRAISVNLNLPSAQARFINCTITGFTSGDAAAASVQQGRVALVHCTLNGNSGQYTSSSLGVSSSGRLSLVNTIVWNPPGPLPQIDQSVPGLVTVTNSIILGGECGASPANPLLDRYNGIMPGSPALSAGVSVGGASKDRHGEIRPASTPDIGADQRLDSDSDTLPDWWEIQYFTNLTRTATGDNDNITLDRLTNYYEYLLGFNPLLTLTPGSTFNDLYTAVFERLNDPWYPQEWWLDGDNDGLTDNYELYQGSSPTLQDTNGDGVSDLIAFLTGLSATSNDTDGDGVANAAELASGTDPLVADTDGDGVNDNLDPLPLDPSVWSLPAPSPTDTTAPVITLIEPVGAVPAP